MSGTHSTKAAGGGFSAQARLAASWATGRRRHLLAGAVPVAAVGAAVWWLAGFQAAAGVGLMVVALLIAAPARRHGEAAVRGEGAAGERRTARMLRSLERGGYAVLHDRAVPRGRASIDHLVIGPVGVVVVDSADWSGANAVRSDDDGRVWVGEHPAEQIIRPLTHEAQRVSHALGKEFGRRVPVTSLVAVHGSRMPLRGGLTVEGVMMLRAGRARHWISRLPKRLEPQQVGEVAAAAGRLFPPTSG